ncbi:serpin family protein [Gorillibacterium sp. sgz500922]|uniref:serpin family protein n=1 Tax=Gorillibacterium sp. sgz500922 TaxID=3446694 RepID=UPI003F66B929
MFRYKPYAWITAVVLLLLSLAACGGQEKATTSSSKEPDERPVYSSDKLNSRVTEANNQTGFTLVQQLWEHQTKNHFFSPLSFSQALGMVYSGAAGVTQEEMADALHYKGLEDEAIATGNAALLDVLASSKKGGFQVKLANSLWLHQGASFSEDFLASLRYTYRAKVSELDFASPQTPKTINDWVNQQTDGRIPSLIDQPLPKQDRMVLLNAISFDAKWSLPFDPEMTSQDIFHRADGTEVPASFMRQYKYFAYKKTARYEVALLPYADSSCSMAIVLPAAGIRPDELMAELTEHPMDWQSGFPKQKIVLELPKFSYSDEAKLVQPLMKLGMKRAFDPTQADFSPITGKEGEPLSISGILQRSFIRVDEAGTEAAAATAVMGEAGSAGKPEEPVRFIVNRPFFYAIQDSATHAVLFAGVVYDPGT